MQTTTTDSTASSESESKESALCTCTAEQELARLGARIDKLIARASKTKEAVKEKVHHFNDKGAAVRKRGEAALHEMKSGLDKAWDDLNQTWFDLRIGTERAVQQLMPEAPASDMEAHPAVPCGCPNHQIKADDDDLEGII